MNREDENTWDSSPFHTRVGPSWFHEAGGGRVRLTLLPNLTLSPSLKVPANEVDSNICRLSLPL